jgi:uncharacterized protein (DUF849 family)
VHSSAYPLIINLAPTGAVSDPEKNPHVPVGNDGILEDVRGCARAGASMVHLHVRDEAGKPSSDASRFRALISSLRGTREGRDLVLCVSTSGRHGQTPDQRAAVLDLSGDAKPDMASLTLSSLNFAKAASLNEPETIRFLAKRMQERGICPELEVFDLGMIHFAKKLIAEGLIKPPYYFNLLLGNLAGAQATLNDVAALVHQLPAGSLWSTAGIGESQKVAAALGCITASGVRIGLEDNIWQDKRSRTPATNIQLVQWLADLARVYGRTVASPQQVRQWLAR